MSSIQLLGLQDFDLDLLHKSSVIAKSSTPPIFAKNAYNAPQHLGSGVLFEFQDQFFFITAGHIFEDRNIDDMLIPTSIKFEEILGEVYITAPSLPSLKYENEILVDSLDLAIIRLEKEVADALKIDYSFLGISNIELGHQQKYFGQEENKISDYYFVFGFPATKIKSKNQHWIAEPLFFFAYNTINRFKNKKLHVDKFHYHLFVNYTKKMTNQITKIKQKLPALEGMSGGGLWDFVGYDINNNEPVLKLVGIMIEYRRDFIISTKIDYVIALIREKFNLPKLPIPRIPISFS